MHTGKKPMVISDDSDESDTDNENEPKVIEERIEVLDVESDDERIVPTYATATKWMRSSRSSLLTFTAWGQIR